MGEATTRHLLLCFLWVLKNVDKSILKMWWIELPHNRLQTLLEVLRITLSCFQYKVSRKDMEIFEKYVFEYLFKYLGATET